MNSKTCTKCLIEKPINDFSPSKRGLLGKRSQCRCCINAIHNEWIAKKKKENPGWYQKRIESAVEWVKGNPEKRAKIAKRRNLKALIKNPERVSARSLVNQRVRFGRMPKASSLKCSVCGCDAKHYHHHNGYAFENRYDVVPVCVKCHNELDNHDVAS